MREIAFTKMHGLGNDYVYINGFTQSISAADKPEIVRRLSDRHFGIGGDGVIFINPASEADFEMEMYNADGSRSEMCGNGIRCVAKFVYDKGLTDKSSISIVSAGKIKYLDLTIAGKEEDMQQNRGEVALVKVDMGAPVLTPSQVPVRFAASEAQAEAEAPIVNRPIIVDGKEYRCTCVSMGNPHCVVFVEDVDTFPLEQVGPLFEHHANFPNRVNAEFVQIIDEKTVKMRVWERGTGETLACGTGSCATAVACVLNGLTQREITVKLLGGDLQIAWAGRDESVLMTGPAATVFEGTVLIDV